ncbi:hydrolases [Striga asiatica]|uniref:Hydrolases n=1 Tax=Striga asiatica TaxID=4170 RepID=A0A5A7PA69_STRAF|nr:hydrolases [Striga asiatica]
MEYLAFQWMFKPCINSSPQEFWLQQEILESRAMNPYIFIKNLQPTVHLALDQFLDRREYVLSPIDDYVGVSVDRRLAKCILTAITSPSSSVAKPSDELKRPCEHERLAIEFCYEIGPHVGGSKTAHSCIGDKFNGLLSYELLSPLNAPAVEQLQRAPLAHLDRY